MDARNSFWVGHDERLEDGRLLIGAPLSPVYQDEAQARKALAEIHQDHPDARLIRATLLEEGGE